MTTTINWGGTRIGHAEAKILALFSEGANIDRITEQTGLSPSTVSRAISAIGTDPGRIRAAAVAWLAAADLPASASAEPDGISTLITRALATERPKLVAA